MTNITESLSIECPCMRARAELLELLDASMSPEPELFHFTILFPDTTIEMQKGVDVIYARDAYALDFDELWTVRFTAVEGSSYPSFVGTLSVRSGENGSGTLLTLNGSYSAPQGLAGELFDKAFIRRVAVAMVQKLLKKIAQAIMVHYNREEAVL